MGDQVLFESQGGGQSVLLVREASGDLALTIDGYWQFSSREEHIFHEVLADAPMIVAPRLARVLILGGGDGLALRNVLRYGQVEHVTLVEIDATVVELSRTVPAMVELNERAFEDGRVEVVIEDAAAWLEAESSSSSTTPWDVVICDFPAPTSDAISPLFGPSFYGRLAQIGHPESVVSIQVSQDLPEFWATLAAVEGAFSWSRALLAELLAFEHDDEAWADFILASPSEAAPLRLPAAATTFMSAAKLDAITVQNREGPRFSTREYGERPEFDDIECL